MVFQVKHYNMAVFKTIFTSFSFQKLIFMILYHFYNEQKMFDIDIYEKQKQHRK